MESEDRRKFRRIGQDVEVNVKPISFPLDAAAPVFVEMSDVSEGGVRVLSPEPFAEGVSLEVSMKLPGWFRHTTTMTRYREENRPLTAVGLVKRCTPLPEGGFEVGIEFTDIWGDHWRAMRQHLAMLEAEVGKTPD